MILRKLLLIVGLFCLGAAGYGLPYLIVTSADSLTCWSRGAYSNGDGTCGEKFAHAPQKPDPKPEAKPVTLSLEASQRFVELENQKAELRKAYNEVLRQQGDLLLGAGASSEQRQAVQGWNGQGKPPWAVEGQQITIPAVEKPKP